MFHVAHPLAWFALGTLVVPILIHLWRRPLPVVRVGSLRPFLSHRRPARPRTLHDWPRLLLRCAILAVLALAVAGLQWTPRAPSPARWCLLLPGTSLRDAPRRDWTLRLREGFEPRWLAPGFPKIIDPTDSPNPNPLTPVWSLLRQADERLAAGSEAWVFSPTWTSLFEGNRPSVANVRIHWHDVPTPPPVLRPPPLPRVGVVHAPDRVVDAGYLRAALEAMGATVVSNEVPAWLFQLGSAPLPFPPDDLERHGVRIVRDAPGNGPPEVVARWIDVGPQTVALRQRVLPGPGAPVLRDSHGEPWLTEERQGAVVLWHVAFRFHPDWTDWVREGAFPAWWQEHLQPPPPAITLIAAEQAEPRFVRDPDPGTTSRTHPPESIDLRAGCWWLGAMLFLVERLLSWLPTHRRSGPIVASGAS